MPTQLAPDAYRDLIEEVHASIRSYVPPDSVVLIVSKGDEELVRIDGYRAWHFPRDAWGSYAGFHPASSFEAIMHLRHLYAEGAQYLVFPATAAWWLEHYRELANLLESAHQLLVSEEGVCVIYQLQDSRAFERFQALPEGDEEWTADGRTTLATTQVLSLTPAVSRSPIRVLTILARFGSEQYGRAEEEVAQLFARQMPGIDRRVIVVDNALPRAVLEERDGSVLIGGDNSSREFSAFDRAVDFVAGDIWSYDLVHFATSAFNTLYVAYLQRFGPELLQVIAGRPACVGHIDCYNEPIQVGAYPGQHWIRSCFFFLPPAEVKALRSFVSVADGTPFFSGNPHSPFRADAPISQRYRDYITDWLTGRGVGQGVQWHSTFELTKDTLTKFEEKARAILNEQLLSIRLQSLGCHLIDVTWLSAMLRRNGEREIPWSTPWREQLARRDRDTLVITYPAVEHVPTGP